LDSTYRRRGIHLFGWIVIGLLALLIVGSLALWGISLATGHAPLFFFGPYRFFFFFPLGFIFFLFFIFFIIRLVFWGGWWGWGRGGRYYRGYYWGDAKEVLRQRYARGEITKEQFDQMNRDLDDPK
jgi:putative membrane protein